MPGGIQMVTNNQRNWTIAVTPKTKVFVSGNASVESLKSGAVVQFVGEVDNKGVVKDKIANLMLCGTDKPLGIFAPGSSEAADGMAGALPKIGGGPGGGLDGGGPGQDPAGGGKTGRRRTKASAGGDGFGEPTGGKRGRHGAGGGDSGLAAGPSEIRGRVKDCRNGRLTLIAGAKTVRGELADNAKVDIQSTDFTAASRGDKVSAKGRAAVGRPGFGEATDIRIELAQTIGEGKKKVASGAKSAAKKASRASKKGGDDHAEGGTAKEKDQ